jgi:disulfide bond formation protein DsbB
LENAAVSPEMIQQTSHMTSMTLPRLAPLLILLASIAIVGGAQLFQRLGGLTPCELCLYERWPYYIAIAVALVGLAVQGNGRLTPWVVALCGLLFLVDAGLAFYHVGVEQHWFAGPTACTGSASKATTVAELTAQIMKQQPVRCDEPQWTLFGISLAGFNLLAALALTVFSGYAALHLARREAA